MIVGDLAISWTLCVLAILSTVMTYLAGASIHWIVPVLLVVWFIVNFIYTVKYSVDQVESNFTE